jgi:2-polyprenyl-3-methyl-5-hydroxy-6-metoxy-1,4-benzoquinol methylase
MSSPSGLTLERIDPAWSASLAPWEQESLRLHLERYTFAGKYVSDKVVVDCACGTGYGSEILARAGARRVMGVDLDRSAIDFARQHHAHDRVRYEVADALAWLPEETPQLWVSLETVEHLPNAAAFLRSVHARLAPDGILIASVPTTVSTDANPHHLADFTRRSWRRMVRAAGFEPLHELLQVQRFGLGDVKGANKGSRVRVRGDLVRFYLRHPGVAMRRVLLTITRGLVNEYLVIVARRRSSG